jgi:putative ABC transport system substrate-binding protein
VPAELTVRRRSVLLAILIASSGVLLARDTVAAQTAAEPARIGLLFDDAVSSTPLRQGLRDLGYVEGRNIVFEERQAGGRNDRWAELVADLLRHRVDVIVTRNTPATLAAKQATTTVPIVMAGAGDPLSTGLVASLARPTGNVTGVTFVGAGLAAKRLELLKAIVPSPLKRVALYWNPTNPAQAAYFKEAEAGARALGVTLQSIEVRNSHDLEAALAAMVRDRPSALLVTGDPVVQHHIEQVIAFVAKHRLPAMYNARENVEAGGLISYGASRAAIARRVAVYVDKILKGARPADLPVEQPTTFELVINRRTARALGLTIPSALAFRAAEVLE